MIDLEFVPRYRFRRENAHASRGRFHPPQNHGDVVRPAAAIGLIDQGLGQPGKIRLALQECLYLCVGHGGVETIGTEQDGIVGLEGEAADIDTNILLDRRALPG